MVMRSIRSTVERRFESYSGSRFFGDESRVCCGCGAGSPFRPSLFNSILIKDAGRSYAWYYCCMPPSPVLQKIYILCFSDLWHFYPYILQHFNEMFFTLVSLFSIVYTMYVASMCNLSKLVLYYRVCIYC